MISKSYDNMRSLRQRPRTRLPSSSRILVFDDDPGFCLLLTKVFRHLGYSVESCSDPARFENLLLRERFDGVILDYFLGGFTGPQAAAALAGKIPTLFVSSDAKALGRLPKGTHSIPKGAGFTRIAKEFESILKH